MYHPGCMLRLACHDPWRPHCAGGADRRGVDDGGKRPASVKASLSVAFGQRAPNRAGAREEGRGMGAGVQGGAGASRRRSPSTERYTKDTRKRSR